MGSLLLTLGVCWDRCHKADGIMTCPVHHLWPFFELLPIGQSPFSGISPAKALAGLRELLGILKMKDAKSFRTQDLRRGHAKDMQLNGATLYEILSAGEWRSPAFLAYLDLMELEMGAVMEAHIEESSSEDVGG